MLKTGRERINLMSRRKTSVPRKSIWDKDYKSPYGTYEGERGSPSQWAGAFEKRFSPEEIKVILGDDSPYTILGLNVGASHAEIRSAYLKLAKATHPDHNPHLDGSEFRKIKAAYESLA